MVKKLVNFRIDSKTSDKLDEKLKRTQYVTRTEFLKDVYVAFLEGRLHIDE